MGDILINAVLEIAGAPKEFVEQTMGGLIKLMENKNYLELKKKEVMPAEENEKVWSTFVEVEVEFTKIKNLFKFCFEFMPSNIEIERPPSLSIRREDLSELLGDLTLTLHKQDMVVKEANARLKLVEDGNKILLKNTLVLALEKGLLTPDEIAKRTGIGQPNLTNILNFYEEKGLLQKKKDKYELKK